MHLPVPARPAPPARPARGDADGRGGDDHDLRRRPVARDPEGHRGREGGREEDRQHRDDRDTTTSHEHEAVDAEGHERVVHEQTDPGRGTASTLDPPVEGGGLAGLEQPPDPADARGSHQREPLDVVLRVLDRLAPRLGVALGLVLTHRRPRSLEAVRVVPDEVPVPHRVAARRRQDGALAGRDGDGFREAGEVVDDPRPQHDRTGQAGDHEELEASPPVDVTHEQRQGEDDEREQQDELAAGQRREGARRAHQHRVAESRLAPEQVDRAQRHHRGEDHRGLRHHHAVADPDLRVDRGDGCGHDAGGVPRELAHEETDHDDRRGAEHRRRQTVRGHAVEPDGRPEREVGAVHGRVAGARDVPAVEQPVRRVDEPVALRQGVRLVVVVERVAPEAISVVPGCVRGGAPPENVEDAHHEPHRGRGAEPHREARNRARGRRGRAAARRFGPVRPSWSWSSASPEVAAGASGHVRRSPPAVHAPTLVKGRFPVVARRPDRGVVAYAGSDFRPCSSGDRPGQNRARIAA